MKSRYFPYASSTIFAAKKYFLVNRVYKYFQEEGIVRMHFEDVFNRVISPKELQIAIAERQGYHPDNFVAVLNQNLSAKQMIELLKEYDFSLKKYD